MTHPLNLLTRTLGRVTFSPVAPHCATGTGTPVTSERIGAYNQRLFLRPCFCAGVESSSMGLCGASSLAQAGGKAGSLIPVVPNPVQFPPFSDWNQFGGEDSPKSEVTIMSNITILASTVRILDGKYSLNDLHKASSDGEHTDKRFQPSNFLRLEQTQALISEITSSDVRSEPVKTATSGKHKGTYVCKELVYAYAMWVSPKFNLAVIRAFDSLSQSPLKRGKEETHSKSVALPAPKTTIVTTVVQGQAATTKTFYGDVTVLPDSQVLAMLDEMSGAMQFMADAYNRLDAVRVSVVEATAVPFDADGSASRRAEAAREYLRAFVGGAV